MLAAEKFNENDCCGNGCANCVLDTNVKKIKFSNLDGKQNILDNFTKFRLLSKVLPTEKIDNVWELHFKSLESVASSYILHIQPGFHLMARRILSADEQQNVTSDGESRQSETNKTKGIYLLRPYSPYWWNSEEMEFKILVNLKLNGLMSNYIRELNVDDEMEFCGPIGSLEYKADAKGEQQLILITQGVALAPVISIIETILQNDDDLSHILHLACFQDIDHIYFREQLYEFQKYWNYKLRIYVAHENCESIECQENERCLENCKSFIGKLKYKEPIHALRLSEKELDSILEAFKSSSKNVFVIIAGFGSFQVYFKNIMEKYNFNTYLL